ncbi:MAG TPA: hypothetical protein VND87_17300 [Stellaceae bacterium]|nr:hypothetical protein [Stellaceae bacterium]
MADGPRITRAKAAERSAREARLAKALRENLRRRKQQVRPRPGDASATDGSGKPPGEAPT